MEWFSFDVAALFDPLNFLVILVGAVAGIFLGALPGVGSMVAVVLFLPISFLLPPLPAILLLLSVYQSSEYGGSIASIVLGIPGSPSNVATILDGYPMAKSGSPGKALRYSLFASVAGGLASGLVLVAFAVPIAGIAMSFSYPEYFLLGMLGVLAVVFISSTDIPRSLISAGLGLMMGTVGMDMFTGQPRFTGGSVSLFGGFTLVAVILGMFAISEIISMVREKNQAAVNDVKLNTSTKLSLKEFNATWKSIGSGSSIGTLAGVFPGMGSTVSSWLGYGIAKRLSKQPHEFGKGAPEGITGTESANNAAVGGSILPLLALGVPGSATIAIVMGAFIMHGIVPGPHIFESDPDLTYGILFGFLFTSVAMLLAGLFLTKIFSNVLRIPAYALIPSVLIVSLIGIYASDGSFFELWVALVVGVVAYFLRNLGYSLPAFVLAFVLSGILEENFRRSLVASGGDLGVLVASPIAVGLVLCIVLIVLFGVTGSVQKRLKSRSITKDNSTLA